MKMSSIFLEGSEKIILGVSYANISSDHLAIRFFRKRKAISCVVKKYWLGQAIQDSAFAPVLSSATNTLLLPLGR